MSNETLLTIDLDRCWGCGTCEVACALEKKIGPGMGFVKVEEARGDGGKALPGSVQGRSFIPVLCQQCDDPACAASCPAGALVQSDSGLVEFDADHCLACGVCASACPYGAMTISAVSGKPAKCDLCASRKRAGLVPACVQHCPGRAIGIGPRAAGAIDEVMARGPKHGWTVGKVKYIARA
jgi:Fe-S-cluster-containing dehydrogenase component